MLSFGKSNEIGWQALQWMQCRCPGKDGVDAGLLLLVQMSSVLGVVASAPSGMKLPKIRENRASQA